MNIPKLLNFFLHLRYFLWSPDSYVYLHIHLNVFVTKDSTSPNHTFYIPLHTYASFIFACFSEWLHTPKWSRQSITKPASCTLHIDMYKPISFSLSVLSSQDYPPVPWATTKVYPCLPYLQFIHSPILKTLHQFSLTFKTKVIFLNVPDPSSAGLSPIHFFTQASLHL